MKVRGPLTTNDGEIAVAWALAGHGIVARRVGRAPLPAQRGIVEVLPGYVTPDADMYAVYAQRHQKTLRVRTFVQFVAAAFEVMPVIVIACSPSNR